MVITSTNDVVSIFKDGKPNQGIYKIRYRPSVPYVDVRGRTKELRCRPAMVLGGKGLVGRVRAQPHRVSWFQGTERGRRVSFSGLYTPP